jgi:tetratricopeptide (TPR) repeat protein
MLRGRPDREAEAERRFSAAADAAASDAVLRAMALYERGQSRAYLERFEPAAADFTAVIEDPVAEPSTRAWSYLQRAYIHAEHGRRAEQFADLTAAIDLHVDAESEAAAYANRGRLHDDPRRRLEDYSRAIAVDAPARWRGLALCGRGEVLAEAGHYEQAEADFDAAIGLEDVEGDDRATFMLNRTVPLGGRDPGRDRADYVRVIEMDGVSAELRARAHLYRAKLGFEELPRLRRAIALVEGVADDLSRTIDLDDGKFGAEAHYLRGCLLDHGHGDAETALADYTAAIETEDATPHTRGSSYIHRGLIYLSLKRRREAERQLTRGIELPGLTGRSVAVGLVDRGLLREGDGRTGEAEQDYRAAIAVADGGEPSGGALAYLADLLRGEGRLKEERAVCLQAARSGRVELVAVALPRLESLGRRARWLARHQRWRWQRQGVQLARPS